MGLSKCTFKLRHQVTVLNSKTMLFLVMMCLFPTVTAISDYGKNVDAPTNPYAGAADRISRSQEYLKNQDTKDVIFSIVTPHILETLDTIKHSDLMTERSKDNDGDQNIPLSQKLPSFFILDKLGNESKASPCVTDMGRLVTHIASKKSPWVLQFFDASGKPGVSLTQAWFHWAGNYDQCRAAVAPPVNDTLPNSGFTGNYCAVDVMIPSIPIPIQWGGCFPSTCTSEDVEAISSELVDTLNSPGIKVQARCLAPDHTVTAATVVAILILTIIGCLAIFGTVYDLVYEQNKTGEHQYTRLKSNESVNAPQNEASPATMNGKSEETTVLIPKSSKAEKKNNALVKLLLAFSVYSNGKKVLDTTQGSGALGAINGIRFLSMSWVVLGHVFIFGNGYTNNQATGMQNYLKRWTFGAVGNAFFAVDTFFAMSGLLLSYLTVKELQRKGVGINWAMFYFHRFWRLTPPYMFAIVIILGLQKFVSTSHFWISSIPDDKPFCENNWWTNLLYVNNLVKSDQVCLPQSWYLANDMQFFILSPLMMVPFYFHWAAGVGSCSVFLLGSWIATGVLSTQEHWGTSVADMRLNHWFDHYYITPWCRIGPYVVGILAGFILASKKGKPFQMPSWAVASGWLVSTVTALSLLYGIHGDISGENKSSTSVAALYNSISRSLWGACICWIIVACSAGYGGPINKFLSWSPFVVLGRLTYMTYLIHLCIINIYFGNLGSLFFMNDSTMTVLFLGILLFSNLAAFVFMLLLESPMIGLERAFLRKEKKQ